MMAFVFTVRHPGLEPTEGTLEVMEVDEWEAMKKLARDLPGIHIVRFEFAYDPNTIATA